MRRLLLPKLLKRQLLSRKPHLLKSLRVLKVLVMIAKPKTLQLPKKRLLHLQRV